MLFFVFKPVICFGLNGASFSARFAPKFVLMAGPSPGAEVASRAKGPTGWLKGRISLWPQVEKLVPAALEAGN
jgi:hypothetical protein